MSITDEKVWLGLDDRYEGSQRDKSGENLGLRASTAERCPSHYHHGSFIDGGQAHDDLGQTREHTPRTFTAGYCRRANQKDGLGSYPRNSWGSKQSHRGLEFTSQTQNVTTACSTYYVLKFPHDFHVFIERSRGVGDLAGTVVVLSRKEISLRHKSRPCATPPIAHHGRQDPGEPRYPSLTPVVRSQPNAWVSMAHLPTTMPREEAQDLIAPRTVICEFRALGRGWAHGTKIDKNWNFKRAQSPS
ncbi:hypothetical protein EDD85DRAFT_790663 [Armillaria nabsnona]|nr:hypothetical protein EDD85DRAFT_790663 [Armillaria nabsnona]